MRLPETAISLLISSFSLSVFTCYKKKESQWSTTSIFQMSISNFLLREKVGMVGGQIPK